MVVPIRVSPCESVTPRNGSRLSPLSDAHIFAGEFGDRLYTSPRDSGERCIGGASPRHGGPKMRESDSGEGRDDGRRMDLSGDSTVRNKTLVDGIGVSPEPPVAHLA